MPYDGPEPTRSQVEHQLRRMLQLSPFTEREAQAKILRAMVDMALKNEEITDVTLSETVFGNRQRAESLLRVQIRDLRGTVAEYYSGVGAHDLVRIFLPKWTTAKAKRQAEGKNYRPVFEYDLKHDLTVKYYAAWRKMCGQHLSRIPDAMQTFRQILQEEPEYADALFALADASCLRAMLVLTNYPQERAQALEDAANSIEAGKHLAPDTWHAHASEGFLNLLRGHFQEANEAFAAAVTVNQEMAEAHPGYLFAYIAANGLETLELTKSNALELWWNPEMQAMHGVMLELAGEDEEAERFFRQALDLDPNSGLCHAALARMLMKAGRADEARAHFERAEILLGKEDLEMWQTFEKSADRLWDGATESHQSDDSD